MRQDYPLKFYYFLANNDVWCEHALRLEGVAMHRTMLKQGNAALIAGLLVAVVVAGLFKLLWLTIHAPLAWIVVLAWLVLPVLPFAIRWMTLRLSEPKRGMDGLC